MESVAGSEGQAAELGRKESIYNRIGSCGFPLQNVTNVIRHGGEQAAKASVSQIGLTFAQLSFRFGKLVFDNR